MLLQLIRWGFKGVAAKTSKGNFTIRLSDDQKQQIAAAADREKRKPSDWARIVLEERAAEVLAGSGRKLRPEAAR